MVKSKLREDTVEFEAFALLSLLSITPTVLTFEVFFLFHKQVKLY